MCREKRLCKSEKQTEGLEQPGSPTPVTPVCGRRWLDDQELGDIFTQTHSESEASPGYGKLHLKQRESRGKDRKSGLG